MSRPHPSDISDIVIGCQTYVLIMAMTAGKRSIYSLPPYAPDSLILYPEIEELQLDTRDDRAKF
jgi:hypothetical protein